MELLYRTSTTITWKEYLNFHMTDRGLVKFIAFELLTILATLFSFNTPSDFAYLLIGFFAIFVLFLRFFLPKYLLKSRYFSCPILQNMQLDYHFYPSFFTVHSSVSTEIYTYKQIKNFIETKTNLYLLLQGDHCFILKKNDYPSELTAFLFSRQKEDPDFDLMHSVAAEALPRLPKPLFEASARFRSCYDIYHTLKYAPLKKNLACTSIPTWILLGLWTIIIATSYISRITTSFAEHNTLAGFIYILIPVLVIIIARPIRISFTPRQRSVNSGQLITLNIAFYDDYLHCSFPDNPPATYRYTDFIHVKESSYFYQFLLTKQNFVIIEKSSCSQDLIDYIEYLKKKINA